jgi:hypothetical protein
MIAYPDGGAWLVQIGESQAILSASFREKGWDKPLLKFLALGFACGRPFPYTAGDRLRLETTTETAGICADFGFQRQPAPEALAAQRSLAVGVLVEEE